MMLKKFLLLCAIAGTLHAIQAQEISSLAASVSNTQSITQAPQPSEIKSPAAEAIAKFRVAISALTVLQGSYDLSCFVKSYLYPSNEKQNYYERIATTTRFIKTEEALYECLVKNAHTKKNDDGLPGNCTESAKIFAMASADDKPLTNITNEFKHALKKARIPDDQEFTNASIDQDKNPKGMSLRKKVLIGGTITLGFAGAAIIAAPILLPGSVAAVKATAIATAAKSAAIATAAKTAATAKIVASSFIAMPLADQINIAAQTVDGIRLASFAGYHARWYIYPTSTQELAQLLHKRRQRKSLAQRIQEHYQGKNKS